MKTLSDVLRETGISYRTLVKYRQMGLVPKPQIIRRGRMGTESLYPDDVIPIIRRIETLKGMNHTLAEIREMREEKGELVAAKPNPDYLTWAVKLGEEVERKYPGHTVARIEFMEGETQPDGSVIAHYRAKIVPRGETAKSGA